MRDETFDIVDEHDRVVGTAPRAACHGNPALIHRAVHVLVVNRAGQLLLQKRSEHKDIQPGRWDTSVGGHLDSGEDYLAAARREMHEELGISGVPLTFLYRSTIRNEIESENIATYLACHEGPFRIAPREITEVRFWNKDEIDAGLGTGIMTPNFEDEWRMFEAFQRKYLAEHGDGSISFCGGDSFPDIAGSEFE